MFDTYLKSAEVFKALSDKNRLMIIDMLSCKEMCACDLLEGFDITQPTLSHHLKVLTDIDLVNSRKEGKWIHYSLNLEKINEIKDYLIFLSSSKESCICELGDGFNGSC